MNDMTTNIQPLATLSHDQPNWTIKVHLTSKTHMRTFTNNRGEGCLFSVVLTDEEGTEIQATMFNGSARKFMKMFHVGKDYYISKGNLKVANKRYNTVRNDYEITLNETSQVEELVNEPVIAPKTNFDFVFIDQLEGKFKDNEVTVIDIIGVLQHVSPATTVKRKTNNDIVPKRDIVIADQSEKSVIVTLWNDLATVLGEQLLLDLVNTTPIIAVKSLKIQHFRGHISLSTLSQTTIQMNPDLEECQQLRSWYDSEGKASNFTPISYSIIKSEESAIQLMYSDRVMIDYLISNPSLGDEKPVNVSLRACMTYVSSQNISYRACNFCKKKVTQFAEPSYWCLSCKKSQPECKLRYILLAKFTDASGSGWFTLFNEEAEKVIGCSAEELHAMKSHEGNTYQMKLHKAKWIPYVLRVSVSTSEYKGDKHQKLIVKTISPIDFAADTKLLLEEISSSNH